MAVAAVDADPADMVLVAERDRLYASNTSLGDVGGSDDFAGNERKRGGDEKGAENADL